MTLREEIRYIIEKVQQNAVIYVEDARKYSYGAATLSDAKNISDEILKLIEKRIDEKIEWANSTPKNKLDKAIKNKEIDEIFFRGFHEGFEEALIQLKQELKENKEK